MLWNKANGRGGRHGPEPADGDTDQRAACHINQIAWGESDNHPRERHQERHAQQKVFAVHIPGKPGKEEAGQNRQRAGNRDSLASESLRNAQISGKGREQADGHKFRGNQDKYAQGHGKNTAPVRAFLIL